MANAFVSFLQSIGKKTGVCSVASQILDSLEKFVLEVDTFMVVLWRLLKLGLPLLFARTITRPCGWNTAKDKPVLLGEVYTTQIQKRVAI